MTFPIHIGTDQEFQTVREFLDAVSFTDTDAAERIGFRSLDQIGRYELIDHQLRARNAPIRDPLNVAVKLFITGAIVDAAEVEALLPALVLSAMAALHLIERRDGGWVSPVLLYQSMGVYLTSDRFTNPDGTEPDTQGDFVFLTLQRTGTDFMKYAPCGECETFLDLGTGNGVAALWAARNGARHAWALDITERSVHFAEFNRRLNGIPNVTVLRGDLYEPVAGLRFDRIAIHPPYSIAVADYIYAYGGDDGEYLARRAVEGAPAHLTAGGIFYCWTTATNRVNAPLEHRVREMLPPEARDECDVAVLVEELQDTDTYAVASIAAGKGHLRELEQWRERFRQMNVESLVYGAILVQRHFFPAQMPVTLRRMRSAESHRGVAQWMFAWESAAGQPHRDRMLETSRPTATAGGELQVRHRMREGKLIPIEYAFRTTYPFDAALQCNQWLAILFSRCDGTRTGAELLKDSGQPPEHFFAGMAALISGGFLETEDFRLPPTLAEG